MITQAQLHEIMPRLPLDKVGEYLPHLNSAMIDGAITTILRGSAFLGQIAWESGELRYLYELSNGIKYNGRVDLGNVHPGDGPLYKGRGVIQLTGRANYRKAGDDLGIDLEKNPNLAAHPSLAFKIAAWYWTEHELNDLADKRDFREITKRINGGYRHHDGRVLYYLSALEVLSRGMLINAGLQRLS